MKRLLLILSVLSVAVLADSCSKPYEFGRDHMYYTGPDGVEYCYMPREYTLAWENGTLPIYMSYTGSWEAFIVESDADWAFIENTQGKGTGYLNLCYTSNRNIMRTLTIRVLFDNEEVVDITINQKAK